MKELLKFIGHFLAYSFNLYARNLIEPDSLCLAVVKCDDRIRFLTFQGSSIGDGHLAARKAIFQMENDGGYDMAAIIYDGYLRLRDCETRDEALLAQVFTLDSFADRRAALAYSKDRHVYMPLRKPELYGDWDFDQEWVREIYFAEGMREYFESVGLMQ